MPQELPAALQDWYAGEQQDIAIEFLTASADGWPHLAHLSRGELVLDRLGHIRIALWDISRSKTNLLDSRKAILMLAVPDVVLEIRLSLQRWSNLSTYPDLCAFELSPIQVKDKSAPYASITSALRFRLHNPDDVYSKWEGVRRALIAF